MDNVSLSTSRVCTPEECAVIIPCSNLRLNILTQNIRSIHCNLPSFLTLTARLNIDCDLIVLTECWLASCPQIPSINNYNQFSTKCNNNQNEGIVVYTKRVISCTVEEPPFLDANCLVIKLGIDTAVVAIYRSPSYKNTKQFIDSLDSVLQNLSTFKNVIILGDINIDIKETNTDSHSSQYLDVTAFHGLLPAHRIPTRLRNCLDHVILKCEGVKLNSELPAITLVMDTSITDHNTVLLSLDLRKERSFAPNTFTKINHQELENTMKLIDLSEIKSLDDPNEAAATLVSILQHAISSNSQTCTIAKRKRIIKDWITPGLLRCMRNRDKLHKKAKQSPDDSIITTTYLRYRNFCNKLLKKIKINYERELLNQAGQNSKNIWSAIKNIANLRKPESMASDLLKSNNTPELSIKDTNEFFANIGKNLADKINQPTSNDFSKNIPSTSQADSFVLLDTDESEISRLVLGLRSECSVGWDSISSSFLKKYRHILVPSITHICRLCLSRGVFPVVFKRSLIRPIHKSGDVGCVNNYRPISILPILSKILERLINKRLVNYLEKNKLLSEHQYGFRFNKSTADAVHDLTDHITQNLDVGKKCLCIFLDLAKAFDTVSIPLLLKKLEKLGVRGLQLDLIKDYLSDRTQFVKINNYTSEDLPITYGIPQGSILGPTLFLVYINELTKLELAGGRIVSFADDTALCFSSNTWDEVFVLAQGGFDVVSQWLNLNILTLNADKTKYMTFTMRNKTQPDSNFLLKAHSCLNNLSANCLCTILAKTESIRYLGIIIDQNLNFGSHVANITSRVRKLIYVFRKLRHVADPNLLKSVYYALCQSLLLYCITVWGGTHKTTLLGLERAQRSVLKVSKFRPFMFPTKELFELCGVLSVRQLFIQQCILKKHSQLNYDPSLGLLKRRDYVFPYETPFKTAFVQRFFPFLGFFLYNKANKLLKIYSLKYVACKTTISTWLKKISYEDTEALLHIVS